MNGLQRVGAQFKGLNMKDPASWPEAPKVLLLLVILATTLTAAYLLDWSAQIEELDAGRQAEVKLKQEYVSKFKQAVNLEAYRKQLSEVNAQIGTMLRQLPNKSQMEALITDINQAGVGRGLQFDLFRPAPQETKREIYAELPIAVAVTGTYHDMGMFAADIGHLSRIVTLNDLNILVNKDGQLSMAATAKTFRYLDEAEQAEQKKAAADAKKKAQGAKTTPPPAPLGK